LILKQYFWCNTTFTCRWCIEAS